MPGVLSPWRDMSSPEFCRSLDARPNKLKLGRPAVDVEFRPLKGSGGVGDGASDLPPMDPMVEERPLSARRMGLDEFGDDCDERTERTESLRNSPVAGEARFMDAAASATCEELGIGAA